MKRTGSSFVSIAQDLVSGIDAENIAEIRRAILTQGERLDSQFQTIPDPKITTRGTATTINADTGVEAGMLIWVSPSGKAYRAVTTNLERPVTDWAMSVNGNVVVLGGEDADLKMLATTSAAQSRLWLSAVPGYATDVNPDVGGVAGTMRQRVGTRRGPRDAMTSTAPCRFNAEQDDLV